ncbi:MAG: NADH-quinone oxidoreductase subunit L [Planctomycetota bacterium]|nr:NADH-quinone oxidoreductase subunit L [Planctomycetota bacterium]MEC9030681.1 NADH-quinone oxidoreductase subunit L [Planctomycetota bacterium]
MFSTILDSQDLTKAALAILLCPLAGFVVQVFFGKRLPRQGDWLPTGCMFIALSIATWMMTVLLSSSNGIEPQSWLVAEGWLSSGAGGTDKGLSIDFGILVDNLTIVMLFVVTLVSFLVHLYSCGYMHGEERYNRFFAFLGLFSFSMLGLCISSNLLFLFMFWELVGLCSYFLIGFYFEKKSAQNAAIKAFMTTRLGDVGFLVGIMIIAAFAGTLDFAGIFESLQNGTWDGDASWWLTAAGLGLFLGALGKSAQFPLHVWLPDAMEGPTPVSALIHAATMVVAGVYLVARMFPFLAGPEYFTGDFFSGDVLFYIALVGSFTAFFAATIAFVQTDIKKVLAYSTISQLGYMFLGLGVGSVSAGIFHLFTHAFFKALLFLGSGSVIHAVHSNEMEDMGGLRKKMPWTGYTFLIGTLAIAGLPFLSGFHSKEAILGNAYAFADHMGHGEHGSWLHYLPFAFGILTAGMTAFYMFRLYFKTFEGKPKNQEAYDHAHESPWTMTVPLCILAVLSLGSAGVAGKAVYWFEHRVHSEYLVPIAAGADRVMDHVSHTVHDFHWTLSGVSFGLFVAALGLAYCFFIPRGPFYGREKGVASALSPLYVSLQNLWYLDRFYTWLVLHVLHTCQVICGHFDRVFVDGFVNFWGSVCRFFTGAAGVLDYWGVDGLVRGIGNSTLAGGRRLRRLQTGFLQEYVNASLYLSGGLLLLILVFYVLVK